MARRTAWVRLRPGRSGWSQRGLRRGCFVLEWSTDIDFCRQPHDLRRQAHLAVTGLEADVHLELLFAAVSIGVDHDGQAKGRFFFVELCLKVEVWIYLSTGHR